MKHNYNKKKYLNRKEFLEAKGNQQVYLDESLSSFSKRALKGMDYLEEDSSLPNILSKIDGQIDDKIKSMEPQKRISKNASSKRFFLPIAAAFITLIVAAFLLLTPSSNTDLFATHFQPMPSAVANTGLSRTGDVESNAKAAAFQAYELGNFQQAILSFEKYLEASPEDKESTFYLGVAFLGEGYSSKAKATLQAIYENPPKAAYKNAAAWYLALAYVQSGEQSAAVPLLETLSQESEDYKEAARLLLKDIK